MSSVQIGSTVVGGGSFTLIAGPCSFESEEHFLTTGRYLKDTGISLIRGGIYKSRTNPDSFQGIGERALSWMAKSKKDVGISLVSEVTDPRQISAMDTIVDCFQVGTRNMFNYELLKELAKTGKPVILKRGFAALVEEWLLAAEYLIKGGNDKVILCERGIRTFETITRNTLDLTAVAYLKAKTDFVVIVDPSHASGDSDLVIPLSKAAKAVGADGLLVEVHPDPSKALSDGAQTLDFEGFRKLQYELELIKDSSILPKPGGLSSTEEPFNY